MNSLTLTLPAGRLIAGLDLGQTTDYTALAILAAEFDRGRYPGRLGLDVVHLERWPLGTGYPEIVEALRLRVRAVREAGRTMPIVVDQTGVGRPVVDFVRRAGIPAIEPVTITAGERATAGPDGHRVPKRDLAAAVGVAFQEARLRIAEALPLRPVLVQELLNFRARITLSGNDTYGAGADEWREGRNDDLVLALALAVWFAERVRNAVPFVNIQAKAKRKW